MTTAPRGARLLRQLKLPATAPASRSRRLRGGPRGLDDQEVASVPRLALTPTEAAAALGIGLTSFKKYVQPQVRIVRGGKLRVIPVSELERWAEENAERVLDGGTSHRFSDSERM
jgi:hypothetical protein